MESTENNAMGLFMWGQMHVHLRQSGQTLRKLGIVTIQQNYHSIKLY